MQPIYLDYNASTPIDPRVAEAMQPYLTEHFGNPSCGHVYGTTTNKAVAKARKQIADMLHCTTNELVFTSGGTESNNYAIKGIAHACRDKGNHIITSSVEHPAVTEVCLHLEKHGFEVTYLPVDNYGMVTAKQVEEAITPKTILITIMHANNEVGTLMPIAEISEVAHQKNILVHSDCAQSIGKIPASIDDLNIDLLSIAGHKVYAPKGIGALYIRKGVRLEKLIHGAGHENNRRAGTENVLEIVGLGKACELIGDKTEEHQKHMQALRDRLENGLSKHFPESKINGHPEKRLPNTCSISFRNMEANKILSELKTVAASAGAACHSDGISVSGVLKAMNVPLEYAMGTIRFSVGRFTTEEEIDRAINDIAQVVEKLKNN
jgi:cysteine desulfurase